MDYNAKSTEYFSIFRSGLVDLIDKSANELKVLEIGAAHGDTLYYLKQKGIATVAVGIDIFEDVDNRQKYRDIDRFIFGNIEEMDFPEYDNYFDLVLLPDVLEHLEAPVAVLGKVHRYLKPEGQIIVSMPNIRHYSALYRIFVQGDFRYDESGIFDYTHKRFYCKKNMQALLEQGGFTVISVKSPLATYNEPSVAKFINSITFKIFEEFLSPQFSFKAKRQRIGEPVK